VLFPIVAAMPIRSLVRHCRCYARACTLAQLRAQTFRRIRRGAAGVGCDTGRLAAWIAEPAASKRWLLQRTKCIHDSNTPRIVSPVQMPFVSKSLTANASGRGGPPPMLNSAPSPLPARRH
jgi:hypothetical protein